MNLKSSIFLVLILVCISLIITNDGQVITFLSQNNLLDKTGHFIGFFILSWLLNTILKLKITSTLISIIIYAGLTELGQEYLGFRNGQISDFIADILGCVFYFICLKTCQLKRVKD
ncbi:VanZ family protein [Thalassomonas sp. M1454]|uniref:VanZ family protein n=1 Tax=Thalassomonas sp. M1454 TaxID=2594477 RepID=UPI00163DDA0C